MKKHLTHVNERGEMHMVDVSDKVVTTRTAVATGYIQMQDSTYAYAHSANHKKGDVYGVARVAAIMAAKKTAELVPLCHPLPINKVSVDIEGDESRSQIHVTVQVKTDGKTGVEMEALNATQVALLTLYDMCKAVEKGMQIHKVRLLEKTGGKSADWQGK